MRLAAELRPLAPTDRRALIAIDLGAESCRVSLLRWLQDGPEIRLIHRFANDAIATGGELHWNMSHILTELEVGLRRCAECVTEGVRSIAVDGWAVDYVRLDSHGRALAEPFCYRDERTLDAMETAHARLSHIRMRELTGVQLSRINTAYQLHAEARGESARWLNLPEYVLHRLGAAPVAERTNASHSQLLSVMGEWCDEIFTALDLERSHAADLVSAGTDVGRLKGPLARLGAFSNTRLIAPACHDTASAIAAIPDAGGDWAYISSGTWSLVGTLLDSPVTSPEAADANFTNLAGAAGKTLFHKNVNGLWLLRQSIEAWSVPGFQISLPELVDQASSVAAPDHLLDVDDPDLLLPGDMPARINRQLRGRGLLELDPSPTNAPAIASLIFHSLASRYAEVLKSAQTLTGRTFRRLYIVGGGSRNALLNRLTEEATGLRIQGTEPESSTLGNFAVQLASLEAGAGFDAGALAGWAATLQTARRVESCFNAHPKLGHRLLP